MRKGIGLVLVVILGMQMSGCAVYMALKQPDKKNLAVLNQGSSRENVITYLGAPISSEQKGNERIEIYQFVQGYSGGAKATRALVHGVLDLATLFIWEIIGTPTEAIVDGTKMTVKVTYDENDKVKEYVYLSKE